MSIESTLERIAISSERNELLLAKLIDVLNNHAPEAHQEVPAPVEAAPAPAPQAPPVEVPPVIPAAPAAPAAARPPFLDQAGLVAYTMEKYKELGPTKGAMIQPLLLSMGYDSLKKLPPEKFAEFYAAVEAL